MKVSRRLWNWFSEVFLPPKPDEDWPVIPWQPLMFTATWIGAWVLLLLGDFGNVPEETSDVSHPIGWIWLSLSLVCPPLGLWALHLVKTRRGRERYVGLWLRLSADIGQMTALSTYFVARSFSGDFRVFPMAIVGAAAIFNGLLVFRDARSLVRTERLAEQIVSSRGGI